MSMKGRSWQSDGYRYGFNGKENDADWDVQDYGFRIYKPELGKFLSVDPLTQSYPELTPYQFASNTPIQAIDLDGLEMLLPHNINYGTRTFDLDIRKITFIVENPNLDKKQFSQKQYSDLFSKGNTNDIYMKYLPKNGEAPIFITEKEYKTGVGFRVNVTYSVGLDFIDQQTATSHFQMGADVSSQAFSIVSLSPNNNIFSANGAARADIDNSNRVALNSKFFGLNGANTHLVGGIYASATELVLHETGFHNMIGKTHQADANGNAIYPASPTLESNQKGQIYPTMDNTKEIITNGATYNRFYYYPNESNFVLSPPSSLPKPSYNLNITIPKTQLNVNK
jgi:RHS repeat-associated protein